MMRRSLLLLSFSAMLVFPLLIGGAGGTPRAPEGVRSQPLALLEESATLDADAGDGRSTSLRLSLDRNEAMEWLAWSRARARAGAGAGPSYPGPHAAPEGAVPSSEAGEDLPVVTSFIRLPDRGQPTVRVVEATRIDSEGNVSHESLPRLAQGREGEGSSGIGRLVEAGEPVILRDLRLLPLSITPVAFDSSGAPEAVYTDLAVEVDCAGPEGTNEKERPPCGISRPFASLYAAALPEAGPASLAGADDPGAYLFIVPDGYQSLIGPLVEWKRQKGHDVVVALTSQTGSSASGIRTYIEWAYYHWETPPTYVVLVGDVDGPIAIPAWTYATGPEIDVTDLPYALLEGDDYFPEVLVGRLSVRTGSELETIVAKILSYERDPYVGNPDWFTRALMIADTTSISCLWTKEWVKNLMLEHGYAQIDTVWYAWYITPSLVFSSINQGVSFINYRGFAYWGGFGSYQVHSLSNGHRLPVVTDIVCEGGDYEWTECFGESWIRAGTPLSPKGAVTYIGTSELYTHTRFNNCLDAGIYRGIFEDGLTTPGLALLRGKVELYNDFPYYRGPGGPNSSVECYFHIYNILGDPGLQMWTEAPRAMAVGHPVQVPVGTNLIEVTVADSATASPIEDALVALVAGGAVAARGWTDAAGSARLLVEMDAPDSVSLTVTGPNRRPYIGYVRSENVPLGLGYWSHTVDDDAVGASSGNGDGIPNPGERIELPVEVKNFGLDSTAAAARAILRSLDPHLTILDSVEVFGDIPPGGVAAPAEPFLIAVSPLSPDGRLARLEMEMGAAGGGAWQAEIDMPLGAPCLSYAGHIIDEGGDGVLDPGESGTFVVSLVNRGALGITDLRGSLVSSDTALAVEKGEASFHDIPPGGAGDNGEDPFLLAAPPEVPPGTKVDLSLVLTGRLPDGDRYGQCITLSLYIGSAGEDDPLGPDAYGYYAFDSGDTLRYTEAPRFEWYEIDPDYGGPGTTVGLGDYGYQLDATTVLDLPFTFRYFGEDYECISVCSNGWIAMDTTWMTGFRNWPIGAPLTPKSVIAPYWDDLFIPSADSCGIFSYYDAAGKRFIVEWSRMWTLVGEWYNPTPQTFQVILCDPAYAQTPTGDGEIIFQYRAIRNVDSWDNYSTVGIGAPSSAQGLEYTYADLYPPQARELADGLSIKWTTELGEVLPTGVETDPGPAPAAPHSWLLHQSYPNPFSPRQELTTITYGLPFDGTVQLAVYNVAGQLVRTLVDGSEQAGLHSVRWDGCNELRARAASGIYFCRLAAPERELVRKIILLN